MSENVKKPILLDSTGQSILARLNEQNVYWSVLAEEQRKNTYSDISAISSIVRSNSLEVLKERFPIGDQIIVPWKDMDDSAHNTDATAYQVAWDLVDVREVEKKDGTKVPGLVLQMHKCSAYGVQFSHNQAFYKATDGLAAGTYNFTLGDNWGKATTGTYQFTLNQAVPAGGLLGGLYSFDSNEYTAWTIESWATADAASYIESVSVTKGSEGTSLGTMRYTTVGTLNSMQRSSRGHNRYSTSAIRQYLNATGTGWWTSQEDFDIRPDQYGKHGFMSGFGDDFLAAIKPTKVVTALNTVEGYSTEFETTYDTFFLPSVEEINCTNSQETKHLEGPYFPYWRERLGLTDFAKIYPVIYDAYKIPALNSSSSQSIRLRSAYRSYAYNAWYVDSSGYVSSNGSACYAYRFSPACVIC